MALSFKEPECTATFTFILNDDSRHEFVVEGLNDDAIYLDYDFSFWFDKINKRICQSDEIGNYCVLYDTADIKACWLSETRKYI